MEVWHPLYNYRHWNLFIFRINQGSGVLTHTHVTAMLQSWASHRGPATAHETLETGQLRRLSMPECRACRCSCKRLLKIKCVKNCEEVSERIQMGGLLIEILYTWVFIQNTTFMPSRCGRSAPRAKEGKLAWAHNPQLFYQRLQEWLTPNPKLFCVGLLEIRCCSSDEEALKSKAWIIHSRL